MPLDPKVEAAKRKAMAATFEKTQREMSAVVDELSVTRRLPVPYESNEPVPVVTLPYPIDAHLVSSRELAPQRKLPFYGEPDAVQNPISREKPWAGFETPQHDVFGQPPYGEKPQPVEKTPIDEEMWRTRHNEWTLQKNAYNPDIASQMRTNVRKAASLTSAVNVSGPFEETKKLIASSINVQTALTYSDTVGQNPRVPKKMLSLRDVWPQGRID